jgi:15-cis-phytoene synthase
VNRAELVLFAHDSITRGSTSFATASKLFDRTTRERAWLLYAWCRKCDDIADGQDHGGAMALVGNPKAALHHIRDLTARALAGETTNEPAFDALGIVAKECGLTAQMADDVIEGFALDADDWRPCTEHDMLQYCYHVAGAVGVMMAVVMGVRPDDEDVLDRACDLGLAFQLANIARDIADDASVGRCYLPQNWLRDAGISNDEIMASKNRAALTQLTRRLCDASELYEKSAQVGAAYLPFRARWAVLSAAGIYGDIARKVRAKGPLAFEQRVYSSKIEKLKWVAKAGAKAAFGSGATSPRDGLWTRQREGN